MQAFSPEEADSVRGQITALIGAVGAMAVVVGRDPEARSAIEHMLRGLDTQLVHGAASDQFVAGGRAVLAALLQQVQP